VQRVHPGPLIGLAGLLALLGGLEAAGSLGVAGWLAGTSAGLAVAVLLGRALARRRGAGMGPADRVTLVRAQLACGVVALAAGAGPVALLVGLAAVALVLDGVDGRVARRTGTASAFGARFDLEVDAFLILVLSGYVAAALGWWVLLIGAARYLFVAAGWLLPWLHGTLPARPWCKVVAVVQGVVLTVAAAEVLPPAATRLALLVALAMLAESFGREVRDLWRLARRTSPRSARARVLVDHG